MKKLMIILMLILSSIVFANGIALEGTLILKDNTTIPIEGFTLFNNLDDYFISCEYNNTDLKIQIEKIYRFDVISGDFGTIYWQNNIDNKVRIELRDGKVFEVKRALMNNGKDHRFRFTTYDVINEKLIENDILFPEVKSIIFEKIGDVSVDPETGQKFPSDYRYNPYTGNKLEPGSFGE